jgi:hypothetical protein
LLHPSTIDLSARCAESAARQECSCNHKMPMTAKTTSWFFTLPLLTMTSSFCGTFKTLPKNWRYGVFASQKISFLRHPGKSNP